MEFDKDLRSIQEVRDLLTQARRAQNALAAMSQEDLDRITAAISAAACPSANGTRICTTSAPVIASRRISSSGLARHTPFFSTYPFKGPKLYLETIK